MDPEEEYHPAEVAKLVEDIQLHQLSVVMIGDWYNVDVMKKINFYDDNAKQWWTPLTGGANVPAINNLFEKFGIMLGNSVYDGEIRMGDQSATYSSGTSIVSFPAGGYLTRVQLTDQTSQILRNKSVKNSGVGVLGIYTPPPQTSSSSSSANDTATEAPVEAVNNNATQSGTIAVFGDSSCFDDASDRVGCNWLMGRILQVTNFGADPTTELANTKLLADPFVDPAWNGIPPARAEDVSFAKHSRVVGANKPLVCPATLTQSHPYEWEDTQNLTAVAWVEREIVPQTRNMQRPSYSADAADTAGSFGYLPMYFLLCVVILFVIALAVRTRFARDRRERFRDIPTLGSPFSVSRRSVV